VPPLCIELYTPKGMVRLPPSLNLLKTPHASASWSFTFGLTVSHEAENVTDHVVPWDSRSWSYGDWIYVTVG